MDNPNEIELLKKALTREKLARKEAESFLEKKSLELFDSNQKLLKLNQNLETQIIKRSKEIEKKEIQFRSLVETATDIIFKIDIYGKFTYINPVTVKISGYTKEELIGQHFSKYIRSDYVKQLKNLYYYQLKSQTENTRVEFPIITKSGNEKWISQSATLVMQDGASREFVVMSRDITEVKLARDAVEQSEEKYRGIIENLELGILEVDNKNKILKAYPQFCKLSGYTKEELIGKSPSDVFLDEEAKRMVKNQMKDRKQGVSGVYELPIQKKDGTIAWVIISGAPFYDMEGNLAGTVGIHLDITKRKSMESQLRESQKTTEELYKVKEKFLANISHEIRTPMNAIIGMAELLEQSKLDLAQQKYLSAIRSSSKNLLVLINDLLDFSKIESGKLSIEIVRFNLRQLVVKNKELIGLKADENGVNISIDIDPQIPKFLLGDPVRIGQVIINLLSNAVKFTMNGNVYISVELIKETGQNCSVRFIVKDQGIGISEEELKTIFDDFSQASRSTTRLYGGTGLGLSISREIVKLMGGDLEVSSKPNKGSSFYFTIDLEKVNPKENGTTEEEMYQIEDNFFNAEVLLVEDNAVNSLLATTILENWNCTVNVAGNGLEAIDWVKKKEYHLILMDVRMPKMGGIEATQVIRKELECTTPIIALTGNAIKGDHQKCLDVGMNDYLSKPFEQLELNKILTRWIDKDDLTSDNLVDISSLKAMGDQKFLDRMIQLFLEETTKEISILENAVENQNVKQIKSSAHKIKPSIKYVSIPKVYENVRAVENWTGSSKNLEIKALSLISNLKTILTQLKTL